MLQALRADPDLLAIAVVLLTSLHMRIGMTSGADDYATKPFFGRVSCAKPLPRSATGARCAYDDFSGAAGVFVTDLRLQSLADFLRTQVISSRGAAYLVDEAGLLVASSAGDALYQSLPGGLEHVKPAESNNPVERASCVALQAVLRQKSSDKVLGDGFVDRSVSLQCLEMADGDALITVHRPLGDALGLRWTLVVASRTAGLLASREEALQAAKAKASFLATRGPRNAHAA